MPLHETGKLTQTLADDVVTARSMGVLNLFLLAKYHSCLTCALNTVLVGVEYWSAMLAIICLGAAGIGNAFGACWPEAFVVLGIMPTIASSVFVTIVLQESHKQVIGKLQPAAAHLTNSLNYFRVILDLGATFGLPPPPCVDCDTYTTGSIYRPLPRLSRQIFGLAAGSRCSSCAFLLCCSLRFLNSSHSDNLDGLDAPDRGYSLLWAIFHVCGICLGFLRGWSFCPQRALHVC